MADLNLSGQSTLATAIQTRVAQLKTAMDERLPVWQKLSDEKKKKWVTSGKDPIMTLAWWFAHCSGNDIGSEMGIQINKEAS